MSFFLEVVVFILVVTSLLFCAYRISEYLDERESEEAAKHLERMRRLARMKRKDS